MAKVNLGPVAWYPWTDISQMYTTPVTGLSEGGSYTTGGICYVCASGTISNRTSITLPTPATAFPLTYLKNGQVTTQADFNGSIPVANGDDIYIQTFYEV